MENVLYLLCLCVGVYMCIFSGMIWFVILCVEWWCEMSSIVVLVFVLF